MKAAPHVARIIDRREESADIFTLDLVFEDPALQQAYRFLPGQFNMLYLPGAGEVPISISSDPDDHHLLSHTIRRVGRVTSALAELKVGDTLGLRGPFGKPWPLAATKGKNILLLTGGLGCAPVVSLVHYLLRRRQDYGKLSIYQGIKHSSDLIWREQYATWQAMDNVEVCLAADVSEPGWTGSTGPVVGMLHQCDIHADMMAMMCGPEAMMKAAAGKLLEQGMEAGSIYLSLERNMQCADGLCGHCQLGPWFVCRDGPVFSWQQLAAVF